MTATRCIACGAEGSFETIYEVAGFPVARCRCGLGRTIVPEGFDPASIYDAGYFEGGVADGYADYGAAKGTLHAEARRALERLERHGARGGKLLEVGCAYGFFLDEAARRFEVTGVEIAPSAADHARRSGHHVVTGDAHAPELAERGPYDVAVLLDVVEHLPDPGAALATLAERVRPGGLLLLTTGDFGSRMARLTGKRWRLMTPPQHLWFFTQASLRATLARAGFEVLEANHPGKRVPVALALFQVARFLGPLGPIARAVARRAPGLALPVNLFDAVRVVARRTDSATLER